MAKWRTAAQRARTRGTEECVGKGRMGDKSATVAGAGAVSRPEQGRAGDAVAGGVGKGAAAGEAAGAAAVFGARSGRRAEAAAKEAETMAVGSIGAIVAAGAL